MPHDTDMHNSRALKGISHAFNGRRIRSVMLPRLRYVRPGPVALRTIGFLGASIQARSPRFSADENQNSALAATEDAISHVRAFRSIIYQPYPLGAVLFSVIVSTHVGVVVVIFNLVLWFFWLLCLMELDHIINVTQDGPNTVFILHVQLKI